MENFNRKKDGIKIRQSNKYTRNKNSSNKGEWDCMQNKFNQMKLKHSEKAAVNMKTESIKSIQTETPRKEEIKNR